MLMQFFQVLNLIFSQWCIKNHTSTWHEADETIFHFKHRRHVMFRNGVGNLELQFLNRIGGHQLHSVKILSKTTYISKSLSKMSNRWSCCRRWLSFKCCVIKHNFITIIWNKSGPYIRSCYVELKMNENKE